MSGFIPTPSVLTTTRFRSPEYKKAILSDLLLSIKDCQKTYGSKQTLATEDDPRISKLCDTWELVLCHGLVETNVASVLKNVTEMVSNAPVELPNFWEFAYIHLQNNERERFSTLHHVWTDRGKTRSLIRATLNEHSLERYICTWLADPSLDKSYEPWALMRDQEASHMLSSMASGLGSILFALSIDNPDLNAVRVIRDVAKPEPIIAVPKPAAASGGGQTTKKKSQRQINIDTDDDLVGGANITNSTGGTKSSSTSNDNLSAQCLLKEKEDTNKGAPPDYASIDPLLSPSQVYNVLEELPTAIQTIVCRSASTPTASNYSHMATSISSDLSVRTELFPEPPTSSSFIYPVQPEQEEEKDESDGVQDLPLDETHLLNGQPSSEGGLSSKRSSVHSSAVSLDVDTVDRLKSRLRDTEERCQYLEARVAELSLENHRLKGISNSPRGGLTFFTVSVPRVHLENNKYYVYEIQILPTYGGDEWTVRKRYRDFFQLHQTFQKTNAGVKALDFPPKKKFGNMDACFVEQRRQRLQVYLRHLLAILPEVAACNSRAELEEVFPFFQ